MRTTSAPVSATRPHSVPAASSSDHVGPSCTDPLYRKAIRTSMGAALTLPFAHASPWPGVLRALRHRGWAVLALTPVGTTTMARAEAVAAGRPDAIVVGHEGEGLTREALEASEHHVRIPMAAGRDSVNVATAAAIALYELTRSATAAPAAAQAPDGADAGRGAGSGAARNGPGA